ncbi:hypothetical protein [Nocardia sp. XZ_19_385]|uniref:hypothetical protein n=1 Tax=Nocardia sp. XZ_19_385 TaxID=2769488 RepID=UPI00188FD69D|nr:hypothetical protein [Nocardia sp. XZ_19_385]
MNAPEPIHDLARGDVGVSRQLSRALRVLMDTATDPQLKNQLRGILEGKGSARDLMHSEAFNRVLDRTLPAAMQQFADMPEEERQRLADQGEAELQRLRSEPLAEQQQSVAPPLAEPPSAPPVVPGTRKPNRERVVTPDDEDEDDEYFRDRGQRGWLE